MFELALALIHDNRVNEYPILVDESGAVRNSTAGRGADGLVKLPVMWPEVNAQLLRSECGCAILTML